jgi:hypothetical protein
MLVKKHVIEKKMTSFLIRSVLYVWRKGGIGLCPAQQLLRHDESLVVFRVRRNVGLRTGLLFAGVALQMAA